MSLCIYQATNTARVIIQTSNVLYLWHVFAAVAVRAINMQMILDVVFKKLRCSFKSITAVFLVLR